MNHARARRRRTHKARSVLLLDAVRRWWEIQFEVHDYVFRGGYLKDLITWTSFEF